MGLVFATALFIVEDIDSSGNLGLIASSSVSIILAAITAYLIAIYRLYIRTALRIYRGAARPIAKRAIRSSHSQHMTEFECTGIINRRGTVALIVPFIQGSEFEIGESLNLLESAGNELWGRVNVEEI